MQAFITHLTHISSRSSAQLAKTCKPIPPIRSTFTPRHPFRILKCRRRIETPSASATIVPSTSDSATDATTSIHRPERPLREILSGLGTLSKPLWFGKRRGVAWMWTMATIVLAFAATMYAVMLSMTQKLFWNVLSSKDVGSFGRLMTQYCALVVLGPVVLAMFEWVKERLALMWRRTLTEDLIGRYFERMNYYRLSVGGEIDNPDARISDDALKFTTRAVRFFTVIGVAIFDFVVFSIILYRVYSPLWYVLLAYSVLGTVSIGYFGRRLLNLNKMQVTREANLRFGLLRVRETTESVAFYAGEAAEEKELLKRLLSAFQNNIALLSLKRNVTFLSTSFRYYAQVVPSAIIAPQYFAGKILLGTISQVYFSFNHVLGSLGLLVTEFANLAEFGAGVRRLKELADGFEAGIFEDTGTRIETRIDTGGGGGGLVVDKLTVQTPTSPRKTLVNELSFVVGKGDRLLIVGRSGVGKSSLMRAICGLWESGSGIVRRPTSERMLVLPQKPFMMLGTLRENILYPGKRKDVSDMELVRVLEKVNLKYLVERMGGLEGSGETLERRLSLGEQQRLGFARIVVSRPELVILDESTSALDVENERRMYAVIAELGVTCVSIGNRGTLLGFHEKVLEIGEGGGWRFC